MKQAVTHAGAVLLGALVAAGAIRANQPQWKPEHRAASYGQSQPIEQRIARSAACHHDCEHINTDCCLGRVPPP